MIHRQRAARGPAALLAALLVGSALVDGRGAGALAGDGWIAGGAGPSAVHTVAVGAHPYAIAVDERVARVYVVSLGHVIGSQLPSSGHASLYTLDATTGRVLHVTPLGFVRYPGWDLGQLAAPPPQALAVDEQAGRVFVLSTSPVDASGKPTAPGRVIVLDAMTSTRLGSSPAGPFPYAVAVAERAGRIVVADSNAPGAMSIVDATHGRLLRTVPAGAGPQALAVDDRRGRVVVMTHSGATILDVATGALRATVRLGQVPCALAFDRHTGQAFLGVGVSRGNPTTVYRLDVATGTLVGQTVIPYQATSSDDACPLAADAAAGRVLVFHTPYYMGGSAFFSLLDSHSGHRLLTDALNPDETYQGASAALAVDERAGHFLVSMGLDRKVRVLDARTGRLVRVVRVGRGPQALAVDERLARVFVANLGDGTVSIFDERGTQTTA